MAISALAIDKAELDKRIRTLTAKFEVMQAKPDKRIPAENLRKAQGIILLDRTKAGFIFAYEGGGGLAMVKDANSGHWSPPAFLNASEASLGFQIGGQQSFIVILLMNTNATRALTDSSINFGGEASGTAGNSTGKAEGTITDDQKQLLLVYSDATGLYGGAAIKGGALSPDTDANVAYYGQSLTPREILFDKKGKPSDAATNLTQKILQASK
ncbi:MAG: lipid-binding SYLF domain-containing protein [Verrucomicrobia bacterium]|nr:lipid-binding SYLF domain-containing protein [Verrucomicrobiota bacterium]